MLLNNFKNLLIIQFYLKFLFIKMPFRNEHVYISPFICLYGEIMFAATWSVNIANITVASLDKLPLTM